MSRFTTSYTSCTGAPPLLTSSSRGGRVSQPVSSSRVPVQATSAAVTRGHAWSYHTSSSFSSSTATTSFLSSTSTSFSSSTSTSFSSPPCLEAVLAALPSTFPSPSFFPFPAPPSEPRRPRGLKPRLSGRLTGATRTHTPRTTRVETVTAIAARQSRLAGVSASPSSPSAATTQAHTSSTGHCATVTASSFSSSSSSTTCAMPVPVCDAALVVAADLVAFFHAHQLDSHYTSSGATAPAVDATASAVTSAASTQTSSPVSFSLQDPQSILSLRLAVAGRPVEHSSPSSYSSSSSSSSSSSTSSSSCPTSPDDLSVGSLSLADIQPLSVSHHLLRQQYEQCVEVATAAAATAAAAAASEVGIPPTFPSMTTSSSSSSSSSCKALTLLGNTVASTSSVSTLGSYSSASDESPRTATLSSAEETVRHYAALLYFPLPLPTRKASAGTGAGVATAAAHR